MMLRYNIWVKDTVINQVESGIIDTGCGSSFESLKPREAHPNIYQTCNLSKNRYWVLTTSLFGMPLKSHYSIFSHKDWAGQLDDI